MTDPLSIIGLASTAVQVTNTLFSPWSALIHNEQEIEMAALLFEVEMARTSRWRMHFEGELESTIYRDKEAVRMVLGAISRRIRDTERMLKSFDKLDTRSLTTFRKSYRWLLIRKKIFSSLRVCRDLNDSLDSLMQDRLQVMHNNPQSDRRDSEWTEDSDEMEAWKRYYDERTMQVLRVQSKEMGRKIDELRRAIALGLQTNNSRHPDNHFSQRKPHRQDTESQANQGAAAMVEQLYELSMQGIFILSKLLASDHITRHYERLKAWGAGLFEGPLGLTKILAKYPDYSTVAGEGTQFGVFHSALIEILLDIEQSFIILSSDNKAVLDFQHGLAKFLEADTPLRKEISTRTLLHCSANQNDPEHDIELYMDHIGQELDSLFVGLRAVDSLRDVYQHHLQSQKVADQANPISDAATSKLVAEPTSKSAQESLVLLRAIVGSLRHHEEQNKSMASPALWKQFEREEKHLEEWVKKPRSLMSGNKEQINVVLETIHASLRNVLFDLQQVSATVPNLSFIVVGTSVSRSLHNVQRGIGELAALSEGDYDDRGPNARDIMSVTRRLESDRVTQDDVRFKGQLADNSEDFWQSFGLTDELNRGRKGLNDKGLHRAGIGLFPSSSSNMPLHVKSGTLPEETLAL